MLVVTGARTTIVQALMTLTGETLYDIRVAHDWHWSDNIYARPRLNIPDAPRYVLAGGYLAGKVANDQSIDETTKTFWANAAWPIRICEQILADNPIARICIVGSESALAGSFDPMYASAKAAVHAYVLFRKTKAPQQLIVIAPGMISDSGMTRRRGDYPGILQERKTVTALEVARVIHRHLWDESTCPLTNAVVRMEEFSI